MINIILFITSLLYDYEQTTYINQNNCYYKYSKIEYNKKILSSINKIRKENNLNLLKNSSSLQTISDKRVIEITKSFNHNQLNNYSCINCGENIAYGYSNEIDALDAWMNSEGHRNNILSSKYSNFSFSMYEDNGILYFVQLFN